MLNIRSLWAKHYKKLENGGGLTLEGAVFTRKEFLTILRAAHQYNTEGNWKQIISRVVCEVLSIIFSMGFMIFLISCVDWPATLGIDTDGADAAKRVFVLYPMRWYGFVLSIVFGLYLIWYCSAHVHILRGIWAVRQVQIELGIDDLLGYIIQESGLTPLQIKRILMRDENYMIALIRGGKISYHMTRIVYWYILFVLGPVFDKPTFSVWRMKRRIVVTLCVSIFLLPLCLLFITLHNIFKYGMQFRVESGALRVRRYRETDLWKWRKYNETAEEFTARIRKSYEWADKYVSLFYSPWLNRGAELVELISGSVGMVLFVLTLFRGEDTLGLLSIFTLIFAASRGLSAEREGILQDSTRAMLADEYMLEIRAHLEVDSTTPINLNTCYVNNVRNILAEIASVVYVNYYLTDLHRRAGEICSYVAEITIYEEWTNSPRDACGEPKNNTYIPPADPRGQESDEVARIIHDTARVIDEFTQEHTYYELNNLDGWFRNPHRDGAGSSEDAGTSSTLSSLPPL